MAAPTEELPPWGSDEGETFEEDDVQPTFSPVDGYEAQVVIRRKRYVSGGELRGFAAMLQVRQEGADDGWVDVERIDTAHGMVHIDRTTADGAPVKDTAKVPARCRANLDAALRWASDYIWDLEARFTGWKVT
jgi:hypothetical protein